MISACQIAGAWLRRVARQPANGIVYIALFLDLMDQRRLIKRFGQAYPEAHADHLTLWHFQDVRSLDLPSLPWGKKIPLKIIGYVMDDQAQVVIVQAPAKFHPVGGRTPHITISTAPGVNPVYANALIAKDWDTEEARRGFPTLAGRVGWYDGERARFDPPK